MDLKENKGCLIAVAIYFFVMGIIIVSGILMSIWRENNPVKYCDELNQDKILVYDPVICKLRYPILNKEEIKNLKEENDKLNEDLINLEYRLQDIQKFVNSIEDEITGPELMQIDY